MEVIIVLLTETWQLLSWWLPLVKQELNLEGVGLPASFDGRFLVLVASSCIGFFLLSVCLHL